MRVVSGMGVWSSSISTTTLLVVSGRVWFFSISTNTFLVVSGSKIGVGTGDKIEGTKLVDYRGNIKYNASPQRMRARDLFITSSI